MNVPARFYSSKRKKYKKKKLHARIHRFVLYLRRGSLEIVCFFFLLNNAEYTKKNNNNSN